MSKGAERIWRRRQEGGRRQGWNREGGRGGTGKEEGVEQEEGQRRKAREGGREGGREGERAGKGVGEGGWMRYAGRIKYKQMVMHKYTSTEVSADKMCALLACDPLPS